MFRKTDSHRHTAAISTDGTLVTTWYDDGWENLLDTKYDFASEAEAREFLLGRGYEEYDPNASLKAMGLKWDASRGVYC